MLDLVEKGSTWDEVVELALGLEVHSDSNRHLRSNLSKATCFSFVVFDNRSRKLSSGFGIKIPIAVGHVAEDEKCKKYKTRVHSRLPQHVPRL